MFETFTKDQKLDMFYAKLLGFVDKQEPLWKVVKVVLTLYHGNASVESGFSINKEFLIENMEEETIVTQRIVFDAIQLADMDKTKFDISKKMMTDVRQSHAAYKSALKHKKDEQAEEDKQTSEERTERESKW